MIPIHEKRFNYDELPFAYGSVSLHGYFQSLKYFEEVKNEFISMLDLPNITIPREGSENIIAFHVRRGDYLKYENIHYVCNTKYFDYFFDIFTPERVKGTRILLFSDSPNHVLIEFQNKEFMMIHSDSDIKELNYMSYCDILVGSNSTFSWWASLIGRKTCYFPSKWFADGREHGDIYREDMILHNV